MPERRPARRTRAANGHNGHNGNHRPATITEQPLRAELYSVSQLERHARTMAGWHELEARKPERGDHGLLARLADNAAVIHDAYALLTAAAARGNQLTPAAEWLIDNYHLIEQQIVTAQQHLPRAYHRELPRLANPAGTPRVYEIALELISHSHGRLDADGLRAFVAAYQTVQPLRLGELWAIPIMLRLALVENLRRVVTAVTAGRRSRERAAYWVGRMIEVAATDPAKSVLVLADLVDEDPPFTDPFVAELATRLQHEGPPLAFALSWLEQRLAAQNKTLDHIFELATQSQAADQVTIGNSIGSLRLLGAIDWRDFVEAMSVVDLTLRDDPADAYAAMDFATRDRYRHVVESIARRSARSENDVARAAIELAREAADRARHVGYFLVDVGRRELERVVRLHRSPRVLARRALRRLRFPIYACAIAGITALFSLTFSQLAVSLSGPWYVAWWCLLTICASQLAVGVVHLVATLIVQPRPLPRLDFQAGIPAAHKTLVAIPAMLIDEAEVDTLVDDLELRYLANRDPHGNLGFALITDFRDADTETTPTDAALVAQASARIEALAAKHGSGVFYLLHRARKWNAREGVWMGWERKRGKLEELNEALRGNAAGFATIVGSLDALAETRYVIALDADTELPRDTARKLAATIAHPLNRPVFDERAGRVVAGYAILQPRVGVSMASTAASRFARLFGGEPGIDPYTRAVSDVYQDVFDEGSFVGKGIYDVDALRKALAGRFPENRILSHDLLEGAHARAGLVTDVLLVEDYPAVYAADVSRRARWIRGDWQIMTWLFPRVPGASRRVRNSLSLLSRWKVLDNLRRSVLPIAMATLLVTYWLSPEAWLATIGVTAIIMLPSWLSTIAMLARRPEELPTARHLHEVAGSFMRQLGRDLFTLACLPYDAWLSLDAILRTLVRVMITNRKLLQWRTSREASRTARNGLATAYRTMAIAPLLAIGVGTAIMFRDPASLFAAGPLLALWIVAPGVAWWLSRPIVRPQPALATGDVRFLRGLARRTWRFFETYVTAEDHFLPPDNFQEEPARVAHRTSPTNIGLSLLANLAAHDFGFLSTGELVNRTARTLATLDRLPRFRGHFYNWYDTVTLEPLRPAYVSTVDSGNLAGHLLTLAAGLGELEHAPLVPPRLAAGLATTLDAVAERATKFPDALAMIARLRSTFDGEPVTLADAVALLRRGERDGQAIAALLQEDALAEGWIAAFVAQCTSALAELAQWNGATAPTVAALATPPAQARIAELRRLATRCRELADLEYDFLYDSQRHLLAIGYNVSDHRLDSGFYDLLASEARLASFVAIAQGKLPQEHWFSLGRLLTSSGGEPALLSWSGSMFEYLMPLLVMPTFENTLLDATYHAVVARQIAYGVERDVPWGVSESGYNKTDQQLNYQYRAFGVPGLGFQRGLGDDLVIAPYACALGLMVDPVAACANLRRFVGNGELGATGLFEAIDYTAARIPAGEERVVIRSYMAHHQGMTLLSLAYVLLDQPMQRRFAGDPSLRATELLLQERVPRTRAFFPQAVTVAPTVGVQEADQDLRVYSTPHTPVPEVHLLSNGHYHVAITNAGGGYSRWRDLAVTRWREDSTRDSWGTFGYLRSLGEPGRPFWSVGHQPSLAPATRYEAIYAQGRAELKRRDGELETHVEIAVSPEDDIELRRISLTNTGAATRTYELTTYAEVVLNQLAADISHPAFSNLFIQTELVRPLQAILCTRRPRGNEAEPWLFHMIAIHGTADGHVSYETARGDFIGRGRTPVDPVAMYRDELGGSAGAVLDPIVALRARVILTASETARLHVVTGVAETREGALALIEKYRDRHAADRVFDLAWTHGQVQQRRLGASHAEVHLYERLASFVIYASSTLRAPKSVLARNRSGQPSLWAYGISGDLPIVVATIGDRAHLEHVRQLVRAHVYWRWKGLVADLVIWNDDPSGYRQALHDDIVAVISSVADANLLDKPGGIFVRRTDQMSEDDRTLMMTVARLIIRAGDGSLADQLARTTRFELPPLRARSRRRALHVAPIAAVAIERPDLVAFNGSGGFTRDGREYVITTSADQRTPAPWINVLANPWFGSIVTESGGAYTWCENAHGNRLTPWHNDAVTDASGEALYVRDEDDGRYWSPTPLPAPGTGTYTSRHGFGYSVFEHVEDGIATEVTTYVAIDAPIKFMLVKVRNTSTRTRKLSLTASFDLVLGADRGANQPYVVSELDLKTMGLFARNVYNVEFAQRIAFLDCSSDSRTVTGDRGELLGRNGSPAQPACMTRTRLSGRVGAGLDPCLAMQAPLELAEGQERELAFVFGSGRDLADARRLITRFRGVGPAHEALDRVWGHWNHLLGALHVRTPDTSLDFLANGWLVYQVLASRLFGRSGFYQSSGAWGFRDQLQDSMALLHAEPGLLREQIVRVAGRQFHEGDVQHWWHPPQGRGVRTRISDDYLWLPYAVCRYVAALGDVGVLDVRLPFLEGRAVKSDEESYYDLPGTSDTSATVYEHCVRAVTHGLNFGVHGLPLMGTGDWNDGMNLVGEHGKGESVWLAFFLYDVLVKFAELARRRGDEVFAATCVVEAAKLRERIDANAWDGGWYRRAYFDDGTPLGSHENAECQIDSLPQSWSVLSRAGDTARTTQALAAVDARLVRRDLKLIELFEPPFDHSALKPGYIKGYVPGVRENGGQYTHAAVWVAMAFAAANEVERAWELFGMLDPIHHGDTAAAIATYQVEPYVVAADVYTNPQHAGRGGWTWYTGSAGWMFQLITESLLGIHLEVDQLRIEPKLPAAWEGFELDYRYRETMYHIRVVVRGGSAVRRVVLDGVEQASTTVPLRDDRGEHHAEIELGPSDAR